MQDLLTELLNELELREEHCTVPRSDRIPRDNKGRGRIGGCPNSASALLAKTLNGFCGYRRGAHAHQDCSVVNSVDERKQLLRKYGDVFILPEIVNQNLLVLFVRGNTMFRFVMGATSRIWIP